LASPAHSADYEDAFPPRGRPMQLVPDIINSAKHSIHVATYTLTSKPIAEALRNAHKRGVDVKVVAKQKEDKGKYAAVAYLANQGVPVRLNSNYAVRQNTFLIVDGRHIQAGSAGNSAAAVDKNAENALIVQDAADLAPLYETEWWRLWDEGVAVKPTN
ncbi:MAG: phospholipase D-like domain-containing protein, partial [Desulfovibrionaceae bacterium]|nr:phospholipase D-like domain-containing protein [Desulfovibrionaceae bacterium]